MANVAVKCSSVFELYFSESVRLCQGCVFNGNMDIFACSF